MIPVPSGVRVWLAVGRTDMRKGMNGLALQVQEALGHDPHAGDLYVFRGAKADLVKIIWHDGIGMSLYSKRLERGRFCVAVAGRRDACHLGGATRLHARRHRLAEPAPYVPAAAGGIARRIFRESPAGIYDSIPAWRPPAKTCRQTLTR